MGQWLEVETEAVRRDGSVRVAFPAASAVSAGFPKSVLAINGESSTCPRHPKRSHKGRPELVERAAGIVKIDRERKKCPFVHEITRRL
jgi:hypothetical protein